VFFRFVQLWVVSQAAESPRHPRMTSLFPAPRSQQNKVGWCSWLSRMLHTHKVSGSSPGSIIVPLRSLLRSPFGSLAPFFAGVLEFVSTVPRKGQHSWCGLLTYFLPEQRATFRTASSPKQIPSLSVLAIRDRLQPARPLSDNMEFPLSNSTPKIDPSHGRESAPRVGNPGLVIQLPL
jgi:hypothetical protein